MAEMTHQNTSSSNITRVVQRRWIRHERPVWPFVWRGLLPVLGLLLLAWYAFWPFARSDIEATVIKETREQLAARGMSWVNVAVSGQHVVLSGSPPQAADGDAALAAARAALCPSWAGRLTCAVSVTGQFAQAAPPPVTQPVPAAPAPAAAAAKACEKSLAEVVAKSKIVFATGSARISAQSASVLDELAAAARDCPGQITIEGHTDSIGSAASNRALSEARAQAVRAALIIRGIAKEQLQAKGLGPDAPIADNSTETGRAQNRRIEFKVQAK
ncbi:MAG: hypothetical protein RL341_653 [Pseudomonadota bacterium]|jgi:outer membrane protein OmpA-like peptidoglycan-associated protein